MGCRPCALLVESGAEEVEIGVFLGPTFCFLKVKEEPRDIINKIKSITCSDRAININSYICQVVEVSGGGESEDHTRPLKMLVLKLKLSIPEGTKVEDKALYFEGLRDETLIARFMVYGGFKPDHALQGQTLDVHFTLPQSLADEFAIQTITPEAKAKFLAEVKKVLVFNAPGINVTAVDFVNPDIISTISVASDAAPGIYSFDDPGLSFHVPFTVIGQPVINNVNPALAQAHQAATITGAYLGRTMGQAWVGGVLAKATAWSEGSINLVVPVVAAGVQEVKVETANGYTALANLEIVAPQITSLSSDGQVKPGDTLEINGTNLGLPGQVFLGNTRQDSFYWAATQITLVIPLDTTPGQKQLTITNSYGNSAQALVTVMDTAPQITAVTPATLYIAKTTELVITGQNFGQGRGAVWLAGMPVPAANVNWADTTITLSNVDKLAVLPGEVLVTIQTSVGENAFCSITAERLLPQITSVAPLEIVIGQTAQVRVEGENFGGEKGSVWIDEVQVAPNAIAWSDTAVTINKVNLLPLVASNKKRANLIIQTALQDQAWALVNLHEVVIPDPVITEITPAQIVLTRTTAINIIGNNFGAEKGSVWIGEVPIAPTAIEWSTENIKVALSAGLPLQPGPANVMIRTKDNKEVVKAITICSVTVPSPKIITVSPATVVAGETSQLKIEGENLGEEPGSVWLNGIYVRPDQVNWSNNLVTLTLPAEIVGLDSESLDIVVQVKGQTLKTAVALSYLNPEITKIDPAEMVKGEAVVVTVYGKNFGPVAGTVSVADQPIDPSALIWKADAIVIKQLPINLAVGEAKIALKTNRGKECSGSLLVKNPPVVAPSVVGFSPAEITLGRTKTLDIYGTDFGQEPGEVWIEGNYLTVTQWNDTHIAVSLGSITMVPGTMVVKVITKNELAANKEISCIKVEIVHKPAVIEQTNRSAAPAGAFLTVTGNEFGEYQNKSQLVLKNKTTGAIYAPRVLSWKDNQIQTRIPYAVTAGAYEVKIVKYHEDEQGQLQSTDSNLSNLEISCGVQNGVAIPYPNPFNPVAVGAAEGANDISIIFDAGEETHFGLYVYDMTGRLIHTQDTANASLSWDGKDVNGQYVPDGVYLIRVFKTSTKELVAKGKILVIKQ